MNYENSVILSGLVHHLSRKKTDKHFAFSIRHENLFDGATRRDFLNARAFPEDVQEKLKALEENTPIRVKGSLRTSTGSGELFLAVSEVEVLPTLELENSVKLSGFVHLVKAQAEGETGLGKYVRFAVRQETQEEHGHSRRDFIVVRVYDKALREVLAGKNSDDPVEVEGTLRSSRGSGVNYVMCGGLR
ncbi:MAG: OB-fold nucleic acid binding domain-containing protein [Synergistaceae bacterium]|nr:OB-fold nucleic acid binding domain-containing protein [Synergistaceae bacterium]MBR0095455.1 OB-fold nucleic acid binding domain-containing protein [Synergistaceae bacterium]